MDTWSLTPKWPIGMDLNELAEELQTADPDLPPAEAAFVKTVKAAHAQLTAGEIDRQEYQTRVRAASDQYRSAVDDGS